jgi:hypothetical protein
MEQDLRKEERDNVNETMMERVQSDEVVTDGKDVLNTSEMGFAM